MHYAIMWEAADGAGGQDGLRDVRGLVSNGVAAFKGISYAAPPFGPNRMRPPVRPEAWDGVRDVTAFAPTVPKPPYPSPFDVFLPEPVIAGDDCLNLNVWTAEPSPGPGLPVMVWIHEGAFVNGSGAVPQYAGDRFARDGVVCVTINYRLGCEGFLFLDDTGPLGAGRTGPSAGRGADAGRIRSAPVERLVRAQRQLSEDIALNPDPIRWREIAANMMAFEPVVDGQVLPVPAAASVCWRAPTRTSTACSWCRRVWPMPPTTPPCRR
ncbi:MAG TPA: carboxylesterase family protein [Streptosporangiaceae bacterium]|nr:carboxylesterase family protein [Streptosporangiaceae bacterium]